MTTYPHDVSRTRRCAGLVAGLVLLAGAAPALSAASFDDFNETFDDTGYVPGGPHGLNDLRVGYSMLPAGAQAEIMSSAVTAPGNFDKETSWDKTGRLGLTWMLPISELEETGGFLVGLEFSSNHCVIETSSKGPGIDLRALALTVHPGLGWEFDHHNHLELGPFLGLGLSTVEEDGLGSGGGVYWEIGFRVAYFYTMTRWQLGVNLFGMYGNALGQLSAGGYDYDIDIRIMGVGAGLQVGYRL
jgi:hypothetical protein